MKFSLPVTWRRETGGGCRYHWSTDGIRRSSVVHHRRRGPYWNNTRIWHWVHISAGAVIGSNCSLGQNVYVGNRVLIGDRVKIQNNVSVYDNVTLEDDVFCGPSMVFTNVYALAAPSSEKASIGTPWFGEVPP